MLKVDSEKKRLDVKFTLSFPVKTKCGKGATALPLYSC